MTATVSPITIDLSRVPNLDARREAEALMLAYSAAGTAVYVAERAACDASPEVQAAKAAHDAADTAYGDHELTVQHDYHSADGVRRCVLSGLPIVCGDDVIEDKATGGLFLRCLVLPPVPVDDAGGDDSADATPEVETADF